MPNVRFLILILASAGFCSGQLCIPPTPKLPNSGYAYIQTEIKALQSIRSAILESDKLESIPTGNDPKNFHQTVEWYGVVQTISDDYDCATLLLNPYKQSTNKSIQGSADALLSAISMTKDINEKLVGMQEALTKTTKPENIDLNAIAKMLATVKSAQGDIRNLVIFAVKMSIFSIERMEGTGDDEKPVLPIVLLITPAEQKSLLPDVRDLAKKKGQTTYINLCGELLLETLTSRRAPMSAAAK